MLGQPISIWLLPGLPAWAVIGPQLPAGVRHLVPALLATLVIPTSARLPRLLLRLTVQVSSLVAVPILAQSSCTRFRLPNPPPSRWLVWAVSPLWFCAVAKPNC